jgi:hypothetical protein
MVRAEGKPMRRWILVLAIAGCDGEGGGGGGDGDADVDSDGDGDADGGGTCDVCRDVRSEDGEPTGLEYCPGAWGGEIHRREALACAPNPAGACPYADEDCAMDADCSDIPGGTCATRWPGCECVRGCATDADCTEEETCLCAGTTGAFSDQICATTYGPSRCLPSNCRTDADCDDGMRCAVSVDLCGDPLGLYCHTAADECQSASDCESGFCSYENLMFRCIGSADCE